MSRWTFTDFAAIAARFIAVWQLADPAFSKFFAHDERVRDFIDHGVANPDAMVWIVGSFESLATLAFLFGFAGRIAAIPVVVIMVVAISLVGPSFGNVAVLVCSLVIAAIGTGPLSVWRPGERSPRREAAAV